MSRRELRERIFLLLFRVEFNRMEDMPEQIQLFFSQEENESTEEEKQYISEKYENIAARLPEIDALINERAKGWSVERMGKVDVTIIRLAVYEICYDDNIPTGVAINEAVELAKKFGQDESAGFVNGVLAKFA